MYGKRVDWACVWRRSLVGQPEWHESRTGRQWVVGLHGGDLGLDGGEQHHGWVWSPRLGGGRHIFEERVFGVPSESVECWICGALCNGKREWTMVRCFFSMEVLRDALIFETEPPADEGGLVDSGR